MHGSIYPRLIWAFIVINRGQGRNRLIGLIYFTDFHYGVFSENVPPRILFLDSNFNT